MPCRTTFFLWIALGSVGHHTSVLPRSSALDQLPLQHRTTASIQRVGLAGSFPKTLAFESPSQNGSHVCTRQLNLGTDCNGHVVTLTRSVSGSESILQNGGPSNCVTLLQSLCNVLGTFSWLTHPLLTRGIWVNAFPLLGVWAKVEHLTWELGHRQHSARSPGSF